MIVSSDQSRSHAPHIDRRALYFQTLDNVLVQVIAADDRRFRKPRLVENLAGFNAEESKVAGIQTDTRQFMSLLAKFFAHRYRVPHAFERIVSIHQENAVIRPRLGIVPEGL